jgi:hypothetical protein
VRLTQFLLRVPLCGHVMKHQHYTYYVAGSIKDRRRAVLDWNFTAFFGD